MTSAYLWIKVVHILAVIAWMAGMLYLPRLFVYHAGVPKGGEQAQLFALMERRLMRFIMLPALLVTWGSGLYLAVTGNFFSAGWLHGKLALVIILTGLHGYFSLLRKDFMRQANHHSAAFFRVINEVPTILLIGIVILVVIKPF